MRAVLAPRRETPRSIEVQVRDPISVLEVAYQFDQEENWLRRVADAALQALDFERGVMAVRYDASGSDWIHVKQVELLGVSPDFAAAILDNPQGISPQELMKIMRTPSVNSLLSDPVVRGSYEERFRERGIDDAFAINAGDPTGHGCMFIFPDARRPHAAPRLHALRCLAAHIAAGNRLRRTLEAVTLAERGASLQAEAVLTPTGRVEEATAHAKPPRAREALREALVRMERARSRREAPERALALWEGLVKGRWSIVESFERDGKRYFLAHRNDPELAPHFALTPRERQVLAYADLGQPNKLIAYTLGLSISSVSTLLSRARRKLRAASSLRPAAPQSV